jgi:hypothetical protein
MASDFTSLDAVPSTFASIPPDTLLTREKAALALTACGVPISRKRWRRGPAEAAAHPTDALDGSCSTNGRTLSAGRAPR